MCLVFGSHQNSPSIYPGRALPRLGPHPPSPSSSLSQLGDPRPSLRPAVPLPSVDTLPMVFSSLALNVPDERDFRMSQKMTIMKNHCAWIKENTLYQNELVHHFHSQ